MFVLYGQNYQRAYPLIGKWNNTSSSSYYFDTPIGTTVDINWKYNDGVSTLTDSISGKTFTYTQEGDNITNHLGSLKLFQNTSSQRISMKLYKVKIWDNGTLVRDFVPVVRNDGVAGMYCKVTDQFFTNAGTGEFNVG